MWKSVTGSLCFLSLSLFLNLSVCINSLHLPLKKHISEFILLVY